MVTPTETKKIFIVVVVLVLLIGGILVIRQQRKPPESVSITNNVFEEATPTKILETPPGVYSIDISPKSIKVNETFTANVIFTARDKSVTGTDVVLRFNTEFLEAEERMTTGDYFSNYPRKEISSKDGLIKVTGFSPVKESPEDQPVTVFTVKFKGKKAGSTKIGFDFQLGKTNMTTIVEKGTSKNILGQVKEAIVMIEP